MDFNTQLTPVLDNTQMNIERVLAEMEELKAKMKQKVEERDDLAKDHRNQQIVIAKWLEVVQDLEKVLAQACSAFKDKETLANQMKADVDTVFQRVIDSFDEYSETEIKETDAIVDGKLIKGAWNPTDYVAQITGSISDDNIADDAWGAEVEVIEPNITVQAIKMFIINNDGENDSKFWSYLQECIGIINKKRSLDTVAKAIADENVTMEELEEYAEEYRKRLERNKLRQKGQQLQLKAV